MQTTHPSQPSLRWKTPLLLLCGVETYLWSLSGGHVPPASWCIREALLLSLPQLWMDDELRILSNVILLFIEACELPVALIFLVISIGVFFRFIHSPEASLKASKETPISVQRSYLADIQAPGASLRHLMITTRTHPSLSGNTQAIRAYITSNGQTGENLCGVFVLVDGRSSTENEADLACFLVMQIIRALLQDAVSDPVRSPDTFKQMLVHSLEQANSSLFQQNQLNNRALRATVTALIVLEQVAYIAHIGINRVYLYREREGLYQLTTDHDHISASRTTLPEHSRVSFVRETLRQLGATDQVLCDVMTIPLHEGDVILLCSDGVWGALSDASIEQIIAGHEGETHLAEQLMQVVQQHNPSYQTSLILAHLIATPGQDQRYDNITEPNGERQGWLSDPVVGKTETDGQNKHMRVSFIAGSIDSVVGIPCNLFKGSTSPEVENHTLAHFFPVLSGDFPVTLGASVPRTDLFSSLRLPSVVESEPVVKTCSHTFLEKQA